MINVAQSGRALPIGRKDRGGSNPLIDYCIYNTKIAKTDHLSIFCLFFKYFYYIII